MKKNGFILYFAIALAVVVVTLPFIPKREVTTFETSKTVIASGKQSVSFPLDLNKADFDQLLKLPGIGPSMAKRVIDYRTKTPFYSIDDIMKVKGIGEKTFEKLKGMITVNTKSLPPRSRKESEKININSATLDQLVSLPGIGKVYANRIIDYRNKHPFSKKEEIVKIKGIGDKTYQKIKDLITVKGE
jgi:competence protein ComEA